MTGAFLYLTGCSIRNGVLRRARRLRRPRYMLLTAGAVLYFGLMAAGRPPEGVFSISPPWQERAPIIAFTVAMLLLGSSWLLPAGAALQFTQAEIQFLFPAPIARRHLVVYKLWRLVVVALTTSAVFCLFVAPPRIGPAFVFVVRTFLIMAILGFYQAGASLYRRGAADGERAGRGRRIAAVGAAVLLTPAVAWVLARFALGTTLEFLRLVPLAFLMLAVTALWVLGSDAAFEEAAVAAADKLQHLTKGGYVAPARAVRKRSTPFKLAPAGPVEGAILWKNWMLMARPSRPLMIANVFVLSVLAATIVVLSVLLEGDRVAVVCFVAAGAVVLLGPIMLRIDLRQELAHLQVVKTWPVRGAALVRGEILAPFIALALGAAIPIVVACASDNRFVFGGAHTAARIAGASGACLVAWATMLAQLVIQNGIAVTFPAWVRITPARGGGAGIENMIQMMVTMYGGLLLLAVAMIVPAGVALALAWLLGATWMAAALPLLVFTVLMLAECFVAAEVFGRILDRADLQDVVLPEA